MPDLSGVLRYQSYFHAPTESVLTDLESYSALLHKWQRVQNLVSRETLPELWTRHFADSLQVLPHLRDTDQNLLDLGSGGGFPALPLAIASRGTGRGFTLVEPNQRKASFLRTVSRELGLETDVVALRSDEIDSRETGYADVITSRALAPLSLLCRWMLPFFGNQTRAVLHKGREHVEELREAATLFSFDVLTTPSSVDPSGAIIILSDLRARSSA
jgi:16S rRNA (guanine527-N7)-methyltransferase